MQQCYSQNSQCNPLFKTTYLLLILLLLIVPGTRSTFGAITKPSRVHVIRVATRTARPHPLVRNTIHLLLRTYGSVLAVSDKRTAPPLFCSFIVMSPRLPMHDERVLSLFHMHPTTSSNHTQRLSYQTCISSYSSSM